MNAVRDALALVREYHRAYLALNVLFYGLMVAGMAYAALDPAAQQIVREQARIGSGPLPGAGVVVGLLRDFGIIFALNLVGGSLLYITFPSLIVPFSGILLGMSRALAWGLFFSPTTGGLAAELVPHLPVLIVEGQAFVLAMLAAYVQGTSFLRPESAGAKTHRLGYWIGVKRSARIYLLIVILLIPAAAYEAVETVILRGAN